MGLSLSLKVLQQLPQEFTISIIEIKANKKIEKSDARLEKLKCVHDSGQDHSKDRKIKRMTHAKAKLRMRGC